MPSYGFSLEEAIGQIKPKRITYLTWVVTLHLYPKDYKRVFIIKNVPSHEHVDWVEVLNWYLEDQAKGFKKKGQVPVTDWFAYKGDTCVFDPELVETMYKRFYLGVGPSSAGYIKTIDFSDLKV